MSLYMRMCRFELNIYFVVPISYYSMLINGKNEKVDIVLKILK